MYRDSSIDENFVSHIWDGGYFAKDALRTKDGRKVTPDYWNQKTEETIPTYWEKE